MRVYAIITPCDTMEIWLKIVQHHSPFFFMTDGCVPALLQAAWSLNWQIARYQKSHATAGCTGRSDGCPKKAGIALFSIEYRKRRQEYIDIKKSHGKRLPQAVLVFVYSNTDRCGRSAIAQTAAPVIPKSTNFPLLAPCRLSSNEPLAMVLLAK